MALYKNLHISGVSRYKTGADYIDIWFKDGRGYRYSYERPGKKHVEEMKKLAQKGEGLATYINKYVRGNYERKL